MVLLDPFHTETMNNIINEHIDDDAVFEMHRELYTYITESNSLSDSLEQIDFLEKQVGLRPNRGNNALLVNFMRFKSGNTVNSVVEDYIPDTIVAEGIGSFVTNLLQKMIDFIVKIFNKISDLFSSSKSSGSNSNLNKSVEEIKRSPETKKVNMSSVFKQFMPLFGIDNLKAEDVPIEYFKMLDGASNAFKGALDEIIKKHNSVVSGIKNNNVNVINSSRREINNKLTTGFRKDNVIYNYINKNSVRKYPLYISKEGIGYIYRNNDNKLAKDKHVSKKNNSSTEIMTEKVKGLLIVKHINENIDVFLKKNEDLSDTLSKKVTEQAKEIEKLLNNVSKESKDVVAKYVETINAVTTYYAEFAMHGLNFIKNIRNAKISTAELEDLKKAKPSKDVLKDFYDPNVTHIEI
jgi:hypothetical protein